MQYALKNRARQKQYIASHVVEQVGAKETKCPRSQTKLKTKTDEIDENVIYVQGNCTGLR